MFDKPELATAVRGWLEKAEYNLLSLSEARNAVKIARRIRGQIRKRLPKEALRRLA